MAAHGEGATLSEHCARVIGTHGRSGLNRLLLGSVAEGLVRVASIPVLLIRAE